MNSFLQILVVNDLKKGTSKLTGRDYEIQDCECVMLDDTGQPSKVGVLMLGRSMMADKAPKPGIYTGTFEMVADMKTRRLTSQLVGLTPIPPNHFSKSSKIV
jgi:hypothetical protein